MFELIRFMHSWCRWLLLVLLLVVIVRSVLGWRKPSPFTKGDARNSLLLMIITDLQLLLGLLLYFFLSPNVDWSNPDMMKLSVLRFWTMEHISMMVLAVVFIHIGRTRSKKASLDAKKHKQLFIYSFLALLFILSSIPWPFLENFKGLPWIR